jgi:integrase
VALALNTGLRRSELFGLRWEDVDFTTNVLTVLTEQAKTLRTSEMGGVL